MMKINSWIFKFSLWALAALLCMPAAMAQRIEGPGRAGGSTFAVVTDAVTRQKCSEELTAYKEVIEEEGLGVYIVSHDWTSPEEVREVLHRLYRENSLEGTVLIGDIPVVMVRGAQHLTSALKIDERVWPIFESTVPSDRFYDDFDLVFTPVTDSLPRGDKFFYELSPTSPQYIQCDIYSARVRAQPSNGDPYDQISAFLRKCVRLHREANPLDTFVSFTGDGSYSNSLTAWISEKDIVDEQFGDLFTRRNTAKYLRFSMADHMKDRVIKELRRDDLDLMVFHQHGMPDRLYLSGDYPVTGLDRATGSVREYLRSKVRPSADDPYEYVSSIARRYGVGESWYRNALDPEVLAADSLSDLRRGIILEEVNDIAPNVRMVVFDACYNGDFRHDDYIAGKFIMAPGDCVATFANSVNVLQDKSAFDLMGLLGHGVRVGHWARNINILESHITGDPTFRFTSDSALAPAMNVTDTAFWIGMLDDPDPETRNLALTMLFRLDYPGIGDLVWDNFRSSPYSIIRYNCLVMLERMDHPYFRDALLLGIDDKFEFIRRLSANRMGRMGDDAFIEPLVRSFDEDYLSARVRFNVEMAVRGFDEDLMRRAIEDRFAEPLSASRAAKKAELLEIIDRNEAGKALATISFKEVSTNMRKFRIQYLRNLPLNRITPDLLTVLEDKTDDTFVRVLLAEALGWYTTSVHKPAIVEAMRRLVADGDTPEELRRALTRSISMLTSPK